MAKLDVYRAVEVCICIKFSLYGKIGDMARKNSLVYGGTIKDKMGHAINDNTWAFVSSLVDSGDWRVANEIEAGAYSVGHTSMWNAFEYIHPIRGGLWQQINPKNKHEYKQI